MSQFALKLIALVAMLTDHIAHVLVTHKLLDPVIGARCVYWLRTGMLAFGRMAFPVFAWFLAEGCRHTSDKRRYLLRLLLFALISEAPFRLCFGYNWFGCLNVIFTMLFAASAIFSGQWLSDRFSLNWLFLPPALAAILLGWFLKSDYGGWGAALAILLYCMPRKDLRIAALGLWCVIFYLGVRSFNGKTFGWLTPNAPGYLLFFAGGMLAVLLLTFYNGKRGRSGKWLFYWFYPLHLLAIFGVSCLLK